MVLWLSGFPFSLMQSLANALGVIRIFSMASFSFLPVITPCFHAAFFTMTTE